MPLLQATLGHTRLVTITDVICRAPVDHGRTEWAEGAFLVLPRTGSFTLKRWRAGHHVADSLHAFLMRTGDEYVVRHSNRAGDECSVISLAPRVLDELLWTHMRAGAPWTVDAWAVDSATDLLHRRLIHGLRRSPRDPIAIDEAAFAIYESALSSRRESSDAVHAKRGTKQRRIVRRAQEILNDRFSTALSLGDVAEALGVSPYHLSRTFHDHTGVPMHRYLVRLRLRHGVERLLQGERDITRLAHDLGFADHSHFTNSFRREVGLTPRVVRADLLASGAGTDARD